MNPFVRSPDILQAIFMAQDYRCRPSDILALDGYEAYCIDAACHYILRMIREGHQPHFGRSTMQETGTAIEQFRAMGAEIH